MDKLEKLCAGLPDLDDPGKNYLLGMVQGLSFAAKTHRDGTDCNIPARIVKRDKPVPDAKFYPVLREGAKTGNYENTTKKP
jgi:hypothetical protein